MAVVAGLVVADALRFAVAAAAAVVHAVVVVVAVVAVIVPVAAVVPLYVLLHILHKPSQGPLRSRALVGNKCSRLLLENQTVMSLEILDDGSFDQSENMVQNEQIPAWCLHDAPT